MAFYLKDGRGDACAGQVRAKPSFCLLILFASESYLQKTLESKRDIIPQLRVDCQKKSNPSLLWQYEDKFS